MNQQLSTQQFASDVDEYLRKEKKVIENFLQGVIELGGFLKEQRDKWKSEGRWSEYISSINRDAGQIGSMIRIYEYSINHYKNLIQCNLNNWSKLSLFLALPDELKQALGEKIHENSVTTDEFREVVAEIKEEDSDVVLDPVELQELSQIPNLEEKLSQLSVEAAFIEPQFAAKKLLQEFQKMGHEFSDNCLPIIEAFVEIEKVAKNISKDNIKKLTPYEKKFWLKILAEQVVKLTKLI